MLNETLLTSVRQLAEWQAQTDSFGPRLTGTEAHNRYIHYIKQEIIKLNYPVKEDLEALNLWQANHCELKQTEGQDPIAVTSPYPYSGLTPVEGLTAEIVFCKKHNFAPAKGKIACVEVSSPRVPTALVMKKQESYPTTAKFPFLVGGPVIASFLSLPDLQKARAAGVLAVILIWKKQALETIQDSYLPFTPPYQELPAIWVANNETKSLKELAKTKQTVTLTLSGTLEAAPTTTLYTEIIGKDNSQNIIINTHTDGPNAIEENGPVALLAFLKYFQKQGLQPPITLTFVFVTGHFQLPQLGINDRQATSRWLAKHPELWGRQPESPRVTRAALTIEHLGVIEWQENKTKDRFQSTGQPSPEFVYTTSQYMTDTFSKALTLSQPARANTHLVLPRNNVYLGEGEPLYREKIPTISFVPGPDYLCHIQQAQQKHFADIDLMADQIKTLLTALLLLLEK